MTAFDLEATYLGLDGAGKVTAMAGGAAFWRGIDSNAAAGAGTLITVNRGEGDWSHWEVHPLGDEVLVTLEGSVRMVFERDGGREETHEMTAGSMLVVPAGVWHRAVNQRGLAMMFITYGAGTEHRPLA